MLQCICSERGGDMRKAYSPRTKREACPECGKKTISYHRTFCDARGIVRKGWAECRSCKTIFDKIHIVGYGYILRKI